LVDRLEGDEAHGRPHDRLADRFRILVVVLLALHERPDKLRRDQPDGVPRGLQLAAQMMRAATRLHAHHARGQLREE
jgi:hypothetical protein